MRRGGSDDVVVGEGHSGDRVRRLPGGVLRCGDAYPPLSPRAAQPQAEGDAEQRGPPQTPGAGGTRLAHPHGAGRPLDSGTTCRRPVGSGTTCRQRDDL